MSGRVIGRPPGSHDRNGRARRIGSAARRPSSWRTLCEAFGRRLRVLREEKDIAASELAAAIGAATATIFSWERGDRMPSMTVLCMVAVALDCSLVDLMPEEAHHRVSPSRAA
jgi:DNA-binding XRE family transcriptional regulator